MESTDDLLDERKQRKLAQMSRRDDERKLDLQSKQGERQQSTATNIGRKAFEQDYPRMKIEVEELFQRLAINNEETSLQELADRLQKLEKFITEHADILRSRDLGTAQGEISSTLNFLSGSDPTRSSRCDETACRVERSSRSFSLVDPSHRLHQESVGEDECRRRILGVEHIHGECRRLVEQRDDQQQTQRTDPVECRRDQWQRRGHRQSSAM